ncbi:MAG: sodium ion-translocating decarboxylase subunit beta [Clostridiales bacterium]|jgi:oxaloacetate decarboxylase beta subunit|nr:sodium ion-translocating decarboxylase subunit beta [Clostridiales bacterium]
MNIGETMQTLFESTGFVGLSMHWENAVMIVVSCVLLYLAIVKGFEPLLLLPIAFGMLLTNLPFSGLMHMELFQGDPAKLDYANILHNGGLFDVLYLGVKLGIYPCLIFLGVGAMTDFGPLLARPSSLLLGAAAQLGIYLALLIARVLGFDWAEAASIGIIGGADGPTAIFLTTKLAPHLLGAVAVAAYSYMALIPLIQPPIMKLMTTKKEREVVMKQDKPASRELRIIFPIAVTIFVTLVLPSVAPLIGCLMFGNLLKECGVVDRLSDTAQNAMMNIVTIFLSLTVGGTSVGFLADPVTGANIGFLSLDTIKIIVLGLLAFSFSTVGGVFFGKVMYWVTGGKVNPLIGSAGVSAVPMAARVSQNEGRKYNPTNFLLMHAMGPNVAGVIGSAVAAGFLLAVFG